MVGAATEYAGAEPTKFGAGRRRIRLALNIPVTVWRAELTPLLPAEVKLRLFAGSSMRNLVRPHVLFVVFRWIERWTSFEQCHAHTQVGQHFHHRSPAGSRADNDNVVNGS